jgi:superfamily I DNA and RNA helicase
VLLSQNSIGKYKTRQFTGNYTCQGEPIWTQGDLLVESVYRYKGQSSPAVILSEIHFAELTLQEKRKLFVGMTRAQMTVEIILSEQAARVMNGLIT